MEYIMAPLYPWLGLTLAAIRWINVMGMEIQPLIDISVDVSSTSIFYFVTNSVITSLVTKQNIEVERVTTEFIFFIFIHQK